MKTLEWKSKAEAQAWVNSFVSELKRPCVILLSGDLGAGKTQIVKWFLLSLGVTDAASPTFAIHQEYQAKDGTVDHVDLYRLQSDADLESSGFWDLLARPDGLLFVEWSDRLPEDVWPANWRKVFLALETTGSESRRVNLRVIG
jgi:tRNA threonylcarbamoyladenosine biosynthesis protein TsaE